MNTQVRELRKTRSIVKVTFYVFMVLNTLQVLIASTPKEDIFTLEVSTSSGKLFSCNSFQKNRATVLLFLSESCPICQKYTPTLKSLWSEFSGENIGFYGVFPSTSIEIDSVVVYGKKYAIPFPLLIDSNQKVTSLLKATITPEVVVLSGNGEILYQGRIDNLFPVIGRKRYAATTHELKDALVAILRNAPVKVKKTEAVGCFIESGK